MLAGLKKRVLVIDCDPQCNLTSFFVPPGSNATTNAPAGPNPHAITGVVDPQDVLKSNTKSAIQNLASLALGAFAGRGIVDANDCMDLGNGIHSMSAPTKYFQPIPTDHSDPATARPPSVGDRLLIIPGSSRIYDFDTTLNRMRGLPGEVMYQTALCTFVRQAAYLTNADFVIIDCGPSSSMLNKNILISSDYILPPTICDHFSLSSMHSFLKFLLPSVIELLRILRKQQAKIVGVSGSDVYANQMAYGHVVPKSPPRILPFIATNFKVKYIADPNYVPVRRCSASAHACSTMRYSTPLTCAHDAYLSSP
mmetsp:Transcript_47674/g.109679  ORF Transcript_47674/g.109679 Transcript_47674/m.109679 type:complete len:310 (+) Transcript_47674:61-990(+)